MSLARRVLSLVALALLPAVAIQGYNEFALRAARAKATEDDALRIARGVAADLEETARSARQALGILVGLPPIRGQDATACNAFLKDVVDKIPGTFFFGVANLSGSVICNSLGSPAGAFDVSDRRYFRDAVRIGGFAVGEPVTGRTLGRPSIQFAQAIRQNGPVVGVMFASVDLAALAGRQARAGLPPDASMTVVDRNGAVLLRLPDHETWVGKTVPDRFRQTLSEVNVGVATEPGLTGVPRILAVTEAVLDDLGPTKVTVGLSATATYADIDAATPRSLILIGLGAVLAILSALASGRYLIRRPVAHLLGAANAWRQGDLAARSGLSGPTEFGQLGEAFDAMAAALQARQSQSLKMHEQQTMMLHELNHRVRNTLATVQSLTRQARRSGDGGDRLEERIVALARTHDMLTRNDWEGTSLLSLLQNELAPFRDSREQHVRLDGPPVHLSPRYVLALGMTFHELTVNAAKYGALSVHAGRIEIDWRIKTEGGSRHLALMWREGEGPAVHKPQRVGFGMRLIIGSIEHELAGSVKANFEPGGLQCVIEVPLDATERFTSFRIEPYSKVA
jgi:two-component sensor histidine kinase